MDLRPISFQSDMPSGIPFSKYYESFMMAACYNESDTAEIREKRNVAITSTRKHCENILQFIRLLEGEFAGPPQWLCTSHYDVVFHHSDYESYSDTPEDGSAITLTVHVKEVDDNVWRFVLDSGSSNQIVYSAKDAASTAAKILNKEEP